MRKHKYERQTCYRHCHVSGAPGQGGRVARRADRSALAHTKGSLNYDCHQAADNPAKFLFHENWTSKAHLDAHLQSMHIQTLSPRMNELCTEFPEITLWERIG